MPAHDQSSGKSKSVAASINTGSNGKVAFSGAKAALIDKNRPAQFFPYFKKNTATRRVFRITHEGNTIQATQIRGDMDDMHSGVLTYSVAADSLVLDHIISDPDLGSGIGSLLMYYFAIYAQEVGKRKITIGMAAPMAVSFYENLGFRSQRPGEAEALESKYMNDPDQRNNALDSIAESLAKSRHDADPENHRMKRRGFTLTKTQNLFANLPEKEKAALKEKKLQEMSDRPGFWAREWLHGRATGQKGMEAEAATVELIAFEMCRNWVYSTGGDEKQDTEDVELQEIKRDVKTETKTPMTTSAGTVTTSTSSSSSSASAMSTTSASASSGSVTTNTASSTASTTAPSTATTSTQLKPALSLKPPAPFTPEQMRDH